MGRLDGKVALLTGGASGLGKATGELMAIEGATVILTDIQDVEGQTVAEDISKSGGKCFFKSHDTTSEKAWNDICDEIIEEYGHLDILLNGAGVGSSAVNIEDMEMSTWRHCLSVNLDGVFLGCKYGIRAMRKGIGGSIINISSILGFAGMATATNYCASKGGVRLLSKAAALECAKKTPLVRVNSIHPGFIDTPMVAGAIQRRGPEFKNYIESNVPYGKLGEPVDIAEGVIYLASDGAKFVTGTELVIDGGFLAR
ncbi:MAG: 3-beta hydroxysteroid dehydrogenase [Rhodospirillaceae bacterium]|nr:3-beta hydroxysteroid dehydrogenase [Rhodospirillaceae bacterium]|tara:strand:+ start:211 stop:978 length:768 start_codon:yes stop_codon:yes gene_type:complete